MGEKTREWAIEKVEREREIKRKSQMKKKNKD